MADEATILHKIISDKLEKIADNQAFQGTKIERTAVLIEELVGTAVNPGRLPKLETHVDDLRIHSNKLKGLVWAWSGLITVAGTALAYLTYFKNH